MNALDQIVINVSPGANYEDDLEGETFPNEKLIKLIAFYLPQFHPIPENNTWWGKGFTEWTNVTKAVPRFVGHYQPRLPGELGFYDLRSKDVMQQQAKMAKRYGINGFCFHHYWFNGQRVLEQPINLLLENPDIDIGYCINWANEAWSRRWDGQNSDVLIEQTHSAGDDIEFARSLEPFFRDPRYIRVDGRPLLMLYRPGVMPDAKATVLRWREHFQGCGLGDPYIVMPQVYADGDPRKYGMDAAVGFPPFWGGWNAPRIQGDFEPLDPDHACEVVNYEVMARRMAAEHPADFTLFPGVCPSWDNEARRPARGFCFQGSTPAIYGAWLERACRSAIAANGPFERMVFINAWNEWAEGAYLEPDRHFGYAYLRETARVLDRLRQPDGGGRFLPATRSSAATPATAGAANVSLARRAANKLAETLERLAHRLR